MNVLLPNEVNRLYRIISDAFVSSLPSRPVLMIDRSPNLAPNLLPVSFLVWNVRGAGSQAFIAALKEVIRTNNPSVFALVETHMSGTQATRIANILNYTGHTRMDAQGFSGGIWVYWKPDLVSVDPIIKHNQYITLNIKRVGEEPWYFTAVYASPYPTKRQDLWRSRTKRLCFIQ